MTKHLLILHRDTLLQQSMADQLAARGFAVACDPEPAICDLIITDDDYFSGGTEEFALWVKAQVNPVLLLTKVSEAPRWLSAGAAACLPKPVRYAELLQRIDSLLADRAAGEALQIGRFRLSSPRREIIDEAGARWPLTEKETAILVYLHAAGERPVPREELLESVWGYANDASTHTVETHIYRLRQKLAQAKGGDSLLATESGGYRLTVEGH